MLPVRTWVKICGTTNLQDAQASVDAGAVALGFIFAPSSRRIEIPDATAIVGSLPQEVEKIGVFVNESPARIAEICRRVGLTGVQLHGDEPPESLVDFRGAVGDRKVIKTLQARELMKARAGSLASYMAVRESIDAILLDSGSAAQRGGTGISFDWKEMAPLAAAIREAMPLIVAGGLSSDNVRDALEILNPWGVDVVSGVEREPGKKDEAKLRDFIGAVRRAHMSAP
jgi:phosphoribosylanthranilate isomerase